MNTLSKLRLAAQEQQAHLCYYCGLPMALDAPDAKRTVTRRTNPLQATAEHLQARCEGGTDSCGNIVAAHRICNARRHQRKQALQPAQFRALVQKRLAKGCWFNDGTLKLLHKLKEELSTAAGGACDEPTAAVGNSLTEREVPSVICCHHGSSEEDSIQNSSSHAGRSV